MEELQGLSEEDLLTRLTEQPDLLNSHLAQRLQEQTVTFTRGFDGPVFHSSRIKDIQ